jgi:hypothetical protein
MVHYFLVRLILDVLQLFAVKRNASVPGRIRFLIVSIITMNGINIVDVPWGTRCSNIRHKIQVRKLSVSSFFRFSSYVSLLGSHSSLSITLSQTVNIYSSHKVTGDV